jgi:hypothetical protein
MGFATGVAAKENNLLWLEAISDAIGDLLNVGLGEHRITVGLERR